MRLIFEKGGEGHGSVILGECDVGEYAFPDRFLRSARPRLPSVGENEVSRHYSALEGRSFGVNDGMYPLGSCTMKYNPKIGEELASLAGFADVHPLQAAASVPGCRAAIDLASKYLAEITGMDGMSLQCAAGAHGEFAGLLLFKAWHRLRGETGRTKIIVPDSAHGTNPASASMAGFDVINIASGADGRVDLASLRSACGPDTAGFMLTNPNTLGLFERDILQITKIVHDAGGLCYYDGANMNAIMGRARPGDMGFDAVHLNLHKTFATPHGGGGPGAAAVGCKAFLAPFLPDGERSVGRFKAFHGNFLVVVRALAYLMSLGREGIPEASGRAVLNANYLMRSISARYPLAFDEPCMHEFVVSLERLKESTGASALDVAKAMQDLGMHPPTMYFPTIVHEALMFEPTETETKETLDGAARSLNELMDRVLADPSVAKAAPVASAIARPDEVAAARKPRVKHAYDN
jgi:glycine dehydrogenase subunit 2